jgi:cephalosporin-C deacetylase
MPWFDLPLDQLREYRTDTAEPPELDLWWQLRLAQARAAARPPVRPDQVRSRHLGHSEDNH